MDDGVLARVFHREMYIDLIRAYLQDYGTEGELARALGVSGAAISYLLTPLRLPGSSKRSSHWAQMVTQDAHSAKEELRFLRTPSARRAGKIAARLVTDAERRDVLLYHMEMARSRAWPGKAGRHSGRPLPRHLPDSTDGGGIDPDELVRNLDALGALHASALRASDPETTRAGYAEVWRAGRALVRLIDGPLQRAQTLLVLNDAAGVLDRADLALEHAREATVALQGPLADRPTLQVHRLQVNALLAEVVALNNLGLAKRAVDIAGYAMSLPACSIEPWNWRRSFREQALKGGSRTARFRLKEVEYLAAEARECARQEAELTIGIDSYLAGCYLAYGTSASVRKAKRLVENLRERARAVEHLVPLRRVRLLRVAAAVYDAIHDLEERDEMVRQALRIIELGGLMHQKAALARDLERVWATAPVG